MAVDTNAGGDAGGESLHDMLNAAYDEQAASIAGETTAPDSAEAPAESATETTETPETQRSADDRPRAPDGKFVKKTEGAASPAAAAAAVDPKAAAATEKPATPQAPVQEPPQHWAPQLRETFKKLPPEAQGLVANVVKSVETDYTRRVQAMQPYQDLAQTAQQWGQYFAQLGVTPAQSFTNLLRAEYMLRNGLPSEKLNMFRQLAQSYGVNIEQVVQPQQQEYVDPQVQTLQQRIEEMHRQQQTLTQQMQQAQQIEQRRQQEMAQQPYISMVEQFANEKDENGTPRHPYFEQVADAMRGLLAVAREAGRNPTLSELYQQAVWSNPQTRAQMIASQAEAAKRKAEAEAKARAAVTRRATASVTGSPSGASMPAPASTIRGELERLMGV